MLDGYQKKNRISCFNLIYNNEKFLLANRQKRIKAEKSKNSYFIETSTDYITLTFYVFLFFNLRVCFNSIKAMTRPPPNHPINSYKQRCPKEKYAAARKIKSKLTGRAMKLLRKCKKSKITKS